MASYNSDQFARFAAQPSKKVKSNEWHSRVRRSYWSFTTPAGGVAVNDTINLNAEMPRGARVVGGYMAFEAMSTGGGTAGVSIGYAGAATRYANAISVDAAGEASFANTLARNFGDELADKQDLVATAVGEAWAAGAQFNGYVEYLLD